MKRPTSIFSNKPLFFLLRFFMGGVFLWACFDKILHPMSFAVVIKDYHLLPDVMVHPMAVTLPWVELFLGLFLIGGLWLPGTIFLANVLLVTFWGALLISLARGFDIHCGCFTTDTTGSPEMVWYVIRDTIFVGMALYLYRYVLREAT